MDQQEKNRQTTVLLKRIFSILFIVMAVLTYINGRNDNDTLVLYLLGDLCLLLILYKLEGPDEKADKLRRSSGRKDAPPENTETENQDTGRSAVLNGCDTARALSDQLAAIDPYRINNEKITTPEQIQRLQEALMEYESRNIPDEIDKIRQAAEKAASPEDLLAVKMRVQTLCTDLRRWLAAFQGE